MEDSQTPRPETGTLVPVKPSELAADEREKGLRRRIDMMTTNDEKICNDVARFAELPHPTLEPAQWTVVASTLANGTDDDVRSLGFRDKKALRRALYGRMSKKDVPFAIQAAHERVLARVRKDNKGQAGNTFNLNMINIPAPKPAGPQERVVIVQPEHK
jgi:hypothetical protein